MDCSDVLYFLMAKNIYFIYALLCKGVYLQWKPSSRCGSPKCVIPPVLYYDKKKSTFPTNHFGINIAVAIDFCRDGD